LWQGLFCATLLSSLLLLSAPALAACGSTAECLRRVEVEQRDLRTLRARFVQIKRLSLLDEPLESSGQLLFKRPDRVRWEMVKPEPLTVVINRGALHIPGVPESEQQALSASPVTAMLSQLGGLFTGELSALEGGFEITATDRESEIVVQLVPREAAWRQSYRRIEIAFAEPKVIISRIRLENALGDTVDIRFEEPARNVEIADSAFDIGAEPQRPLRDGS
jgi:outer membrane lipoprotein-sorting protein